MCVVVFGCGCTFFVLCFSIIGVFLILMIFECVYDTVCSMYGCFSKKCMRSEGISTFVFISMIGDVWVYSYFELLVLNTNLRLDYGSLVF